MSDSWDPARFNWRSVLSTPNFNPGLPFIFAFGVGCGILVTGVLPVALIILGLLTTGVVLEWSLIIFFAGRREARRLRKYRATFQEQFEDTP